MRDHFFGGRRPKGLGRLGKVLGGRSSLRGRKSLRGGKSFRGARSSLRGLKSPRGRSPSGRRKSRGGRSGGGRESPRGPIVACAGGSPCAAESPSAGRRSSLRGLKSPRGRSPSGRRKSRGGRSEGGRESPRGRSSLRGRKSLRGSAKSFRGARSSLRGLKSPRGAGRRRAAGSRAGAGRGAGRESPRGRSSLRGRKSLRGGRSFRGAWSFAAAPRIVAARLEVPVGRLEVASRGRSALAAEVAAGPVVAAAEDRPARPEIAAVGAGSVAARFEVASGLEAFPRRTIPPLVTGRPWRSGRVGVARELASQPILESRALLVARDLGTWRAGPRGPRRAATRVRDAGARLPPPSSRRRRARARPRAGRDRTSGSPCPAASAAAGAASASASSRSRARNAVGSCPRRSPRRLHDPPSRTLQSLQLLDQRRALDVQQVGRLALVAAGALERAPDQACARSPRPAVPARCPSSGITTSAGVDRRRAPRGSRPADPTATICARPGDSANARSITFSSCRTLPGQSNAISACCASCASVTRPRGGSASRAKPIEEVLREQRDVGAPLAQRRHAAPG